MSEDERPSFHDRRSCRQHQRLIYIPILHTRIVQNSLWKLSLRLDVGCWSRIYIANKRGNTNIIFLANRLTLPFLLISTIVTEMKQNWIKFHAKYCNCDEKFQGWCQFDKLVSITSSFSLHYISTLKSKVFQKIAMLHIFSHSVHFYLTRALL